MVNIDDFIKRLEIILDYYGLSASGFADKVGVQRSSLSHLLSGRNKPSLDLILKINENFPEVDLYWILNGKGNFPELEIKTEPNIQNTTPILNSNIEENMPEDFPNLFSDEDQNIKNPVFENIKNNFSNTGNTSNAKHNSEIERIVVFYKNGSFKNYLPE
ncbi:helix-turn-helix domain-containing protein [Flavobacterium psychrophilum]|uniref:helix-turn-helix domain-containing protein n=3 Tax=Flavobacterium psychrophilum TaxID=96345 RepID=UPI000A39F8B3|nr:helix-turn-helix transcriptional regulator [Flavobacterium psychrophilum]EKT3957348.1 helix-turn-helix transcriptional regulator [Flavobacterium psychrophilum]EKT4497744.1 helix-turn-helix transcriptional regulator [Flavobacterium psychrophilum]EKT4510359.1 helix-turn-helix transcriptional regulator [Flavobacterium psychrophilum]EKT4549168.1 helix-turn-helix transcriptional regulator [Flavobacterium psychrophilum]EKT4551916.1 helix-turn-helix transcriptional regulator [Flavobacterium psychr